MALLGAAVLQLMAQVATAADPTAGDSPLAVGTDEHLLVDDHFFTPLGGGAALAMHPPAKGEMLIRPDKPWERILWWYVTILKVSATDYRLYCASQPKPAVRPWPVHVTLRPPARRRRRRRAGRPLPVRRAQPRRHHQLVQAGARPRPLLRQRHGRQPHPHQHPEHAAERHHFHRQQPARAGVAALQDDHPRRHRLRLRRWLPVGGPDPG